MKKERFKRRIRKITAFAAAVAMAVSVMFPGEAFGNIDFGITVFAEESGYDNGFCTDYADDNSCSAHENCNGYQPATLNNGVYEIGNAGQLYWFAALVNGTNGLSQDLGANAILTDNITINTNVLVNGELNSDADAVSGFRKWTPIGKDISNAYTGTFNGNDKTISGLYYSEYLEQKSFVGFIGYNMGSVINTNIDNSYIYINSSSGTGNRYAGFLVGFNRSIIKKCKNYGLVNVEGKNAYIGGLCGNNGVNSSISECTNYGKITAVNSVSTLNCTGGVSGCNFGILNNCNNEGNVTQTGNKDYVGGICGANYNKEIKGCHNSGTVEGNCYVGGVCGVQERYSSSYNCTIANCYNTGNVKGTYEVGGICGSNSKAETIENCYSAGSVSGAGSVGGVCGYNKSSYLTDGSKSTIRNCYFVKATDSDKAIGDNDGDVIVEKVEGKSSEDFSEGEVCYLLNNGTTDGSQVWYQTLDSEAYPNLDTTNKESRTVYACTPCTGVFSNTEGAEAQHSYIVNTEDSKIHICENCGNTHNAVFTADDTTDTISVCCDLGSVTLTAPTEENLTYDGTEKAATVTGVIEGFDTPKIFYKEKVDTGVSLFAFESNETAPVNVGTYTASITYTDEGSAEHTVSVEYTIKQAELTVEAGTYKVSKGYDGTVNHGTGSGEFKVNGLVTGDSVTINTDSIGSYSSAEVGESNVEVDISLTYDSGNYKLKNTKVSVPAEIYARVITADDLEFFDSTFTKTYDGTTDSNAKARIKETVFGTAMEISGTAVYDSKDVNGATKVIFTPDNVTVGNFTLAPTETIEHPATITAKPITVTADDNSKTYGASDPTFTYTVDPAAPLAEGDTLTGALDRTTGENVGTYDITQGTLTNVNNPNYDITFNKGTFTISGAEISEIVITGITAPVKMVTLDTDADTSTTGCSLSAVSWTDGDTTAGFDKAYTATVVVTADSNHTFGSSLTATVNGETASVTKNADGTVTVTYKFAKTAAAAVTKIEMKTSPTKTEYFVGEDIDITGATIIATYEDGDNKVIDITEDMIPDFDSSTAGTKTVTVEYESKTTTFNVTIKEPAVTAIRISTKPKTEYLIGDSLDVSGGEITVSYEYGADKVIPITSTMVTGFNSSAAVESQTLTVTYQEKTATYTITVKKHTPTVTAPTASAITLGQTLAASTLSDNTWSWEDSSIQPTSAGTYSYTAVKTVDDADYYNYTALDGFTFNSATNTLTTEVSVVVNRVGASVTPPTASNTLTYGQALSAAGLTEGWTWENASTIPEVNNTGFTAYKIVTDYNNYDYSNLTGFDYDEATHKLSCKVAVTVKKAIPNVTAPTATAITYGQALSASKLSDTKWSWIDGTVIPTVTNSGYAAKMTVDDSNYDYTGVAGYDSTKHTVTRTISVTVTPAQAKVLTAPSAIKNLVYDGNAKALVTAGTASDGTMVYSLDGVSFSAAIPTATEAGTYTVYYKASGDANHSDSAVGKVSVTIESAAEIITGITVSKTAVVVTYGYEGTTITSRTENVAFANVTVEMVEWMKNSNIQLVIDFVNYSTAGSDTIILTSAQMKAIEYVLAHDFGV